MRKQSRKTASYDDRYQHKLNMLGPGQQMMKGVGVLLAIGIALRVFRCYRLSAAAFMLAGAVLIVLLGLVAIELHQDRVLNDIAAGEHERKIPL